MTGNSPQHDTVSQALMRLLEAYGVDTVFGIPGNHTVELYRHLGGSGIRHVTSRHEQGAAFMADGYARASGRPGVCLLISGPGLLNAATAIAQARGDSVPLLVITAVAPTGSLGLNRGHLHELPDQRATAATLCRSSHTLLDPGNLAELVHAAFVALSATRPGPVHLEIPLDLMTAPCPAGGETRPVPAAPAPDPGSTTEAAQRLRKAREPLILVGGGATGAAEAVTALAERVDAPVLNTVNGKGVCRYGHPLAVGGSPSLPCLRRALARTDCLLAIGTELAETDFDLLYAGTPAFPTELIRLDIDPAQLPRNAVASLPLLGDAGAGARALAEAIGRDAGDTGAPGNGGERARTLRADIMAEPHYHPEMAEFLHAVAGAVPEAVLVGDSTRPTYYAAWQYECTAPRRYFHSVTGFGTLGYAIPAAVGAALAGPGPVMALIGDGGAQFTWGELQTAAELGTPIPIMVWCNDGYEEIANSMAGAGVDPASTRISRPDLAHAAAGHGCGYRRVRDGAALAGALADAVAAAVPTVIELRQQDFLSRPSGGWYR